MDAGCAQVTSDPVVWPLVGNGYVVSIFDAVFRKIADDLITGELIALRRINFHNDYLMPVNSCL